MVGMYGARHGAGCRWNIRDDFQQYVLNILCVLWVQLWGGGGSEHAECGGGGGLCLRPYRCTHRDGI